MLPKEEVEVQLQLPLWKAKFTHQIGSLSLVQQSFGVRAGDSQHANLPDALRHHWSMVHASENPEPSLTQTSYDVTLNRNGTPKLEIHLR